MYCTVIVPFLDEEALLPRFLASLERQTRRPDHLVLCDDGSSDGSGAQADAFAADRDWVDVRRREKRDVGSDRLAGAPELVAFTWAVGQLAEEWDAVVKMDADLELAPGHFEQVLAAMEADPGVGMAGSYLSAAGPDGVLRVERHLPEHVRGPTRFYRRDCYEQIMPIPHTLGWDGADEVRARALGWRTMSIHLVGEPSLHLRPTGTHDGRLRAHARWGSCQWAVGAHPLNVLAGGALRAHHPPVAITGLAYVGGWATARLRGWEPFPDDIRRAKRAEDARRMRAAARRTLRA